MPLTRPQNKPDVWHSINTFHFHQKNTGAKNAATLLSMPYHGISPLHGKNIIAETASTQSIKRCYIKTPRSIKNVTNPLSLSLCCVYPVRLQIQCVYSLIHDSTFCNRSHLHLQLPLRHDPSRGQEHQTPDKQTHACEDLATSETPIIPRDQRTTDWIPRQRT